MEVSRDLLVDINKLGDHVGEVVTLQGWVETTRGHGKVAFVVARDGTGTVQCVLVRDSVDGATWELYESLNQEALVSIKGKVKEDVRAPGGYEIEIHGLELIATADDYPIQRKEHGVDFLLDHRHLCLLYTSPSPRDLSTARMPSSA